MIVHIRGKLLEATPLRAVIEAGGLGYAVHIPVTTAEQLPEIGQEASLHTVAVYREADQTLYGFHCTELRALFELITSKVSGVGPKIALNLLSRFTLAAIQQAVAQADHAAIAKCPGIGKKTAERFIIELKEPLARGLIGGGSAGATVNLSQLAGGKSTAAVTSKPNTPHQDAYEALLTLGYRPAEADKALAKAAETLGEDAATEALIKHALQR